MNGFPAEQPFSSGWKKVHHEGKEVPNDLLTSEKVLQMQVEIQNKLSQLQFDIFSLKEMISELNKNFLEIQDINTRKPRSRLFK